MTRIALVPLDERPVNTKYPEMIAAIAGADLLLPPPEVLSDLRVAANRDALWEWVFAQAGQVDVLIASVEMLGYGGLIASRITHENTLPIMQALNGLRALKAQHPQLKLHLFNVITRISNADYNLEEPEYWDRYGVALYRYSQAMHRRDAQADANDIDLPPMAHVRDFTHRRLRNHMINLYMLELLDDGVLDLLVMSSDDTSLYGFGSQEKAWLQTWQRRLHLDERRLLMYPGADEVGCVLLMRAVNADAPPLKFYIDYAIAEDQERIAPYEDSPIRVTVERQIAALGGVMVMDEQGADLIVAVNPPSRIGQEYDAELENFTLEQQRRAPYLDTFVRRIGAWVDAGRPVVLCDVAYPNGSDPDLIARALASIDVRRLAAYGAWNTAGNTIGTALAQGAASLRASTPAQHEAQQRFLLHRFLEDWGYQHLARQQVRDWLESQTGYRDTTPDNQAEAIARIHLHLNQTLSELGAWAHEWEIARVMLPWRRTFEVDFDLVRRGSVERQS